MKKKGLGPYILFGLVITVIAVFVIPFFDRLVSPEVTYAEGLKSASTYILAAAIGISFAFCLYRGDNWKRKIAEQSPMAGREEEPDLEMLDEADRRPGQKG